MKRVDLIEKLEEIGCEFVRHGGRHDWYRNPNTGVSQPVPRHREVGEQLAKRIIRMLSSPETGDPESEEAGGSPT